MASEYNVVCIFCIVLSWQVKDEQPELGTLTSLTSKMNLATVGKANYIHMVMLQHHPLIALLTVAQLNQQDKMIMNKEFKLKII